MTTTIEYLDTDVKIPYDEEALLSGDPVRVSEYLLDLVKVLQDLLEKITIVSNYSIDLVSGEAVYFALRDSEGEYPDGTWRRLQVGDNLETQKKIAGAWIQQQVSEPPV